MVQDIYKFERSQEQKRIEEQKVAGKTAWQQEQELKETNKQEEQARKERQENHYVRKYFKKNGSRIGEVWSEQKMEQDIARNLQKIGAGGRSPRK